MAASKARKRLNRIMRERVKTGYRGRYLYPLGPGMFSHVTPLLRLLLRGY